MTDAEAARILISRSSFLDGSVCQFSPPVALLRIWCIAPSIRDDVFRLLTEIQYSLQRLCAIFGLGTYLDRKVVGKEGVSVSIP